MKTKNTHSFTVAAFVLTLLVAGCAQPGSESNTSASPNAAVGGNQDTANEPELFVDADADQSMVASAAAGEIETQSADTNPPLRSRHVRARLDGLLAKLEAAAKKDAAVLALHPIEISLNFFADRKIVVSIDEIAVVAKGNVTATGKIKGDIDSSVSIVINNGLIIVNARGGEEGENAHLVFEVRHLGSGVHAVAMRDADKEESGCGNDSSIAGASLEGDDGDNTDDANAATDDMQSMATPLATPVIDMLVAYTPNARIKQGGTAGIKALIQMGIADTNRAFADSGITARVRLVGTMEVKTNETSSLLNDLYSLRSKTDGKWDEVHAERARVGADQVSLVGAYTYVPSPVGIGFGGTSSTSAFTVTKAAAFSQYSFSHELGHNLGLNHSDGYVNYTGRFRTIIAYGNYTRIRRYSNPSLTYNGYRTGDSSHNEAAIINRYKSRLAGFLTTKISTSVIP